MSESPMSPLVPRARFSEIDQARIFAACEPVTFRALAMFLRALLRRSARACPLFFETLAREVTLAGKRQEGATGTAQYCGPSRLRKLGDLSTGRNSLGGATAPTTVGAPKTL